MSPTETAGDVMTTDVVTVTPQQNILVASKTLLDRRVSNAPVVDSAGQRQMLVGFVSERDLMQCYANGMYFHDPETTVAKVMRLHPICVKPVTDIFTLAMIFMQHEFRHLPVVERGELLGMVSRHDCLGALLSHYEKWLDAPAGEKVMPDLERLFPQQFIVG